MTSNLKKRFLGTCAVFALSACSVQTPALTDERLRQAATSELSQMFPSIQVVSSDVTLDDAIQRSVINNLENRLQRLERSFASRQVNVDSLDMLPVLAANAGYTRRSNEGYTTSQPIGQPITGSFSRGSDDQARTSDLSVSWSALDFALGYYNAQQAGNRAFIAEERARRAGMDVIRQAKDSYWRAYAAQALGARVAQNISEAEAALDLIKEGENSGSIPSMQALEQSRTVLENIRQLETLRQELTQAQITLAQMINVPPGEAVRLRTSSMPVPQVSQSLNQLEQEAFLRNPSIREQQYRTSIALTDVKRTTAELFPNLSANAQMNYSSDDFLRRERWNTFGLNVGLNLLQLATAPQRRGLARDGVEVEQARALAVRMAVLAQTHIAYRDYQFSRQQYARVRQLAEVEQSIAEQSRAREAASAGSAVQRVTNETSAILSQLRVYRAYADLMSAHATLQSTVGSDDELISLIAEQRRLYETAVADVAEAEQSLHALDERISDEERNLENLQRSLADAERAKDRAIEQASTAVAEQLAAETELATAVAAAEQAEADLVAIRDEYGAAENALEVTRAELTALLEQSEAVRASRDEQQDRLRDLQTARNDNERDASEIGRSQQILSQRIADYSEQLTDIDAEVAENESQVQALNAQLASIGLADMQASADRIADQRDAVSEQLDEAQTVARESERALNVIKRSEAQAQRDLERAVRDLARAEQRLADAQQRQEVEPDNSRLVQRLDDALAANESAKAMLSLAEDAVLQASTEVASAQTEAAAAVQRVADLEQEYAALSASLSEINVTSTQRDASRISRELSSAQARLERSTDRQQELQTQLTEAQRELSDLQVMAAEINEQVQQSASDITNVTELLVSKEAELEQIEQRIDALEQQERANMSSLKSLERNLSAAERAVRDSFEALESSQSTFGLAISEAEQAAGQQEAAEAALNSVNAQITSQETLIIELREQYVETEDDLQNAEARVDYYGAS